MTEEEIIRRERLQTLRNKNIDPYPARVKRTRTIKSFLSLFEEIEKGGEVVELVGRVRTIRTHGGLSFTHVDDGSGQVQLIFKKDRLGEEDYKSFVDLVDMGDFLETAGRPFVTQKGERSLLVDRYRIICKSLLPLPEKWHGLTDQEVRYRQRYLDLLMNPEVKSRAVIRSKIISSIRMVMDAHEFLEVETPTLQPIYGGGFAKPFKTHHNALGANFYLRISDEMYLKRLLVGGLEKVYEITKVFRNEGIDRDHNPEFTMFEAQAAYEDYLYGMDLFEEIFETAAKNVLGTTEIKHEEITISVKRPWPRLKLVEAVETIGKIKVSEWSDIDEAKKSLIDKVPDKKIVELKKMKTLGEVIAFAFEELVEEKLIQPTIIYNYPVEVSPLAKKTSDPCFVERFEAFALGSEIGNNYSELNDPADLEQRFVEEKKKAQAGFDEAHQTDLDYLTAIKHGMPPACGLGIGVDRMVMLLTGAANIKEVILFPTLRPEAKEEE
jgi:lysyl-tRNA synthetase class 2